GDGLPQRVAGLVDEAEGQAGPVVFAEAPARAAAPGRLRPGGGAGRAEVVAGLLRYQPVPRRRDAGRPVAPEPPDRPAPRSGPAGPQRDRDPADHAREGEAPGQALRGTGSSTAISLLTASARWPINPPSANQRGTFLKLIRARGEVMLRTRLV